MVPKKGRVPSPPPPREESSSDESESESESESEATPATQKAPQNPNPLSTDAADADSSDGSEEESSDSEFDANAFQLRPLAPSSGKPSESDAQEEDGSSSDSPELVQKKEARKPKAEAGKKRQAAESSPSASGGKAKKAKADVEKAAPLPGKAKKAKTDVEKAAPLPGKAKKAKADVEEAAPLPGKAKKAKAGAEKAPSELNASSQGKKHVPDQSPSKPAVRRWTFEDEIKILEALVNHVKTNGTQPSAVELIAILGDSLERKNCSKIEMYEKIRNLKQRHEKIARTGILPGSDDELRKFNLSEEVWGESAKEVAAAPMSQSDPASSKSKKGQTAKEKKGRTAKEATDSVNENVVPESSKGKATKEKVDGDTKGKLSKKAATTDTPGKNKKQGNHKEEMEEAAKTGITKEATSTVNENVVTESSKGQATKEKVDGDTKGKLPKKAATTNTPGKSKKQGDHKEEMEEAAKTGTTNETTNAATENGGTSVRSKSGNSDQEKKDGGTESLEPKEAMAVTQNDDIRNEETHGEEMDIDPNVENIRRGFDELQNLYPNLTSYVERIQAHHPCGETLKRAYQLIADEKASALESKIKLLRVAEMKAEIRRADTKKELTNIMIGLLD